MRAIQAMCAPRSVGRHEKALQPIQNSSAPTPYPTAMETPLTRPCNSGLRGSNEGVSEKPKKTIAPTPPP